MAIQRNLDDLDLISTQDVGHRPLKQDDRDINLVVFQTASHGARATQEILVFNLDTGPFKSGFFEGQMQR